MNTKQSKENVKEKETLMINHNIRWEDTMEIKVNDCDSTQYLSYSFTPQDLLFIFAHQLRSKYFYFSVGMLYCPPHIYIDPIHQEVFEEFLKKENISVYNEKDVKKLIKK